MNDHVESNRERLLELLADQAVFGLEPHEQNELGELRKKCPEVDANEMDRVVGLLEASSPATQQTKLPPSIKESILKNSTGSRRQSRLDAAIAEPIQHSTNAPEPVVSKTKASQNSGKQMWVVALLASAASLLLAFSASFWQSTPTPISVAEQRLLLINKATDLVRVEWASTDEAKSYSGDVVWSNASQQGFMALNGLPKNDPGEEQYQLWIFDDEQDERYPIDGGVFNINIEDGEAVVAIDAKIKVTKPTMFAVTIEKPGGVVVSDRSRLPLIAKL